MLIEYTNVYCGTDGREDTDDVEEEAQDDEQESAVLKKKSKTQPLLERRREWCNQKSRVSLGQGTRCLPLHT